MEGGKTLKIRLTCSVSGTAYSYAKNSVHDAPEDRARDLVRAGYAELVEVEAEQRQMTVNEQREIRAKVKK